MSKIALVHDYFIQMGGAERVADEMHKLFPNAHMFTTVDKRRELPAALRNARVRTSWMQRLPRIEKKFRHYFMLYPFAIEGFDLSEFDLILSSSSGYAKGVRKRKNAIHVCYCHTPMRWVWRYDDYAAREQFSSIKKKILPLMLAGLRRWDLRAAKQPDYYIANSHVVARRIKEIYGRESTVIAPPIDVNRFSHDGEEEEDFYLILSRLAPYKHLDLAVEACRKLNRPLIVIGNGTDRERLEKLAGKQTKFLGRQPDEVVARYASRCRALLFTGEEDFGMTPLEVNAAGRPVIAYGAGGATETLIDGVTGILFGEQTVDSLIAAIEEFETLKWNRVALRQHAEKFDTKVFAAKMLDFLREVAPVSCAAEIMQNGAYSSFPLKERTA